MKILHLPTSTGGNAFGLSRAERELGLTSDVLSWSGSYLQYPADIMLHKAVFKPLTLLTAAVAAFSYPPKYDILHFNYGSTLVDASPYGIDHWDLPFYKKQKLFVTYNGSDARLSFESMYPEKQKHPDYANISDLLYATPEKERRIKKRIIQFEKLGASFFALNPDLVRVLPNKAMFIPYTIASFNSIETTPYKPRNDVLKIVHAPTNRVIKGTKHILAAIKKLEIKYPGKIELQLVENMDNETAMKMYRNADVIIDQLRIGWYGAFAVEAMKMGKPVIVYLNHDDLQYIPVQMACDCKETFIEADCDTIESVIEHCLNDREMLRAKAITSLEYVYRWHDPIKIAQITKTAYEKAHCKEIL